MKILVALNIVVICLVFGFAAYVYLERNSVYQPQLISLGSYLEREIQYGEFSRVYGFLVKGESFSFLYPTRESSMMEGMHASWLEAPIWLDPKLIHDDCDNSYVVVSGKTVPYFGYAVGFDELSGLVSLESTVSCMPKSKDGPTKYFEILTQRIASETAQ